MYEKLYRFGLGRRVAALLAAPPVSRAAGRLMNSRFSRAYIRPFMRANHIRMDDFISEDFQSFNAFFTRRIKPGARAVDARPNALACPCDGFLTAYPLSANGAFAVKGTPYTAQTLTGDGEIAREFLGGWCLVFRLTPANYHRYHFPDDGAFVKTGKIPGVFHTVRPEALANVPVYKTNAREYALLNTKNFGRVLYMEVGATMVGRIVNARQSGAFARGEEKGRFEFGGSTVILLLRAGVFAPRGEILTENREGREAPVRMGEALGFRIF